MKQLERYMEQNIRHLVEQNLYKAVDYYLEKYDRLGYDTRRVQQYYEHHKRIIKEVGR